MYEGNRVEPSDNVRLIILQALRRNRNLIALAFFLIRLYVFKIKH
jgi:hypothetical protein